MHDEKAEIQKQKEYFAKLRTEFQPDGGKVRDMEFILTCCLFSPLSCRMIMWNKNKYQIVGQVHYNIMVAYNFVLPTVLMRSLPSSVHTFNFQRKGKTHHINPCEDYASFFFSGSLPVRPPPSGAHVPLMTHYQNPRRVASADALTE